MRASLSSWWFAKDFAVVNGHFVGSHKRWVLVMFKYILCRASLSEVWAAGPSLSGEIEKSFAEYAVGNWERSCNAVGGKDHVMLLEIGKGHTT